MRHVLLMVSLAFTGTTALAEPTVKNESFVDEGGNVVETQVIEDREPGKDGKPDRKFKKRFKKMMRFDGPGPILGRYKMVWKSLDLSAEQKTKLFALQQRFGKTVFELDQEKERGRFDMQNALSSPNLDESKANAAAEVVAEATKDQLTAQIEFVKEMRGILTPEQLKKLHEQMQKFPPEFGGPR